MSAAAKTKPTSKAKAKVAVSGMTGAKLASAALRRSRATVRRQSTTSAATFDAGKIGGRGANAVEIQCRQRKTFAARCR